MAASTSGRGLCLPGFPLWLDCVGCFQEQPLSEQMLRQRRTEERKQLGSPSSRRHFVSYEEEQEARERAKVERAKMAWKKASRAAIGKQPESPNAAGFRKAADALIRAAERRSGKVAGSSESSGSPPTSESSTSFRLDLHPDIYSDMQAKLHSEILAEGEKERKDDPWKSPAFTLSSPSSLLGSPRGGSLQRREAALKSPSDVSKKSANLNALLNSSRSEFSSSPDRLSASPSSSPASSPRSVWSKPKSLRVGEEGEEEEEGHSTEKMAPWSVSTSRNSVDSPRLSQSQALLAKLGAVTSPGGSSASGSPTGGATSSLESPRRRKEQSYAGKQKATGEGLASVKKSPSRLGGVGGEGNESWENRRESKNFSALKEEAYDVLMVQNQKRMQKERQRRASTEVVVMPPGSS